MDIKRPGPYLPEEEALQIGRLWRECILGGDEHPMVKAVERLSAALFFTEMELEQVKRERRTLGGI